MEFHFHPNNSPPLVLFFWLNVLAGICFCAFENADRITQLPGQPNDVYFDQYSGYITVDETSKRSLFYWLTEANRSAHPETKPLMLWLNGGPGCSSIGYGAVQDIGPFRINSDGNSLYTNPYSWNREANLLFLESPAGVGFSRWDTSHDLPTPGDQSTAEDTYKFLEKWLERFPQYKGRDFYIAGEGYAGHFVIPLSLKIYNKKNNPKSFINLKGILVENPLIDGDSDFVGTFEYWWNHGLISDSTYKILNDSCIHYWYAHDTDHLECVDYFNQAYKEMGDINMESLYALPCASSIDGNSSFTNPRESRLRHSKSTMMPRGYDPCADLYSDSYFNLLNVQKALHVNVTKNPYPWTSCSETMYTFYKWEDSPRSMLLNYKKLIAAGLRIWVYSGDTDTRVPVSATRRSINALQLLTVQNWYPWVIDDGRVCGWSQRYKGLTFVTVWGAGNQVSGSRPKEALFLLKSFLQNKPMPKLLYS